MTPLPSILNGAGAILYPFTQTYICFTGKSDAQSSAATRWVQAPPILQFDLTYQVINKADKNTLKAFNATAKGQVTTNFQATTDQVYGNLSFESDEFISVEQRSTQYGVRLVLTQTVTQNLGAGASGGAYPTLSTTAISELPYTQKQRFQTIVSKTPFGAKYTYAEFGGGLTNFPTGPLMAWEFDEQCLTLFEVNQKVAHFLANWGDCFPFTFKDEDGTTYTNVHYASPQLAVNWLTPNIARIKTGLVQMS
jgi:hypothetical protein